MPFTEDEWDAGRADLGIAILFIFKQRPGLTWSLQELMIELGNLDRFPTREEMEAALLGLVAARELGARQMAGTIYYRRTDKRLGFRPPER